MTDPINVRRVNLLDAPTLDGLAEVLRDCVEGGASVGFMARLSTPRARDYWLGLGDAVERGERALLVAARRDGRILGTVQLVLQQPENQPHRADLSKMLVHREARGQGIAALLLVQAHLLAQALGKTLLVLDTANATAARLYARHGWIECGQIPRYALMPDGALCATTLFFRDLSGDLSGVPAALP